MKRYKIGKLTLMILFLLYSSFIFSACGEEIVIHIVNEKNSPDTSLDQNALKLPTRVISFWHWLSTENTNYDKILNDAIQEVEKTKYPKVKIEMVGLLNEHYKDAIKKAMAANNPPDIFMTWHKGFIEPFIKAERVYPIHDDLEADPEWKNSFLPGILDEFTFQGKVYAVPLGHNVTVVFYNKEIFSRYNLQPPSTYSEFLNVCRVLHENEIIPLAMGNKETWVGAMHFELLVERIGGHQVFWDAVQRVKRWDDPVFLEAGRKMQQLMAQKAFPSECNSLSPEAALTMFREEKAAMYIMGTWSIPDLIEEERNPKSFHKIDYFRFPLVEGGKGDANYWLGAADKALAISNRRVEKDAAVSLVKLLTSEKYQSRMWNEVKNLTATDIKGDHLVTHPILSRIKKEVGSVRDFIPFYDMYLGQEVGVEFNNAIRNIISGEQPEVALLKVQKAYNSTK